MEMTMGILEEAKNLGLNNYEAKVYLALLEREYLTVNDIAKISHVPQARIYDVLESLMGNGMAILRPGKIKRYHAVEPEVFKEKLIEQLEAKLVEQKQTIEKTILTFKKKFEVRAENPIYDGTSLNYIEIIKDTAALRKRIIELVKNCKKEILFFIKPPFITRPKAIQYDPSQNKPFQVEVKAPVRTLIEIPTKKEEIELWANRMSISAEDAKNTRAIKELPMKMAIYDERIVLLHLKDPIIPDSSYTTQIINQPEFARTMKLAFESLWEQAEDSSILKKLLDQGD
jgi:HTH-type transcriptional regulator, sugar sensing transcriptional regulator